VLREERLEVRTGGVERQVSDEDLLAHGILLPRCGAPVILSRLPERDAEIVGKATERIAHKQADRTLIRSCRARCKPYANDGRKLSPERAGVVREAVAGAERAHARGDLGVAVRGQVRKEVVLDLMAQVPREDVEHRAALDVAGAEDLPDVPVAPRLLARLLGRERPRAVGEMPAEDHDVRPEVAHEVRREVAGEHPRRVAERERGKEDVVLEDLAGRLAEEGLEARPDLGAAAAAAQPLVQLEVVEADAPLEEEREEDAR